jgi:hypothetical protein
MMGVLNNHIFILMVTHRDSKKKYDYLKPHHGILKIEYWAFYCFKLLLKSIFPIITLFWEFCFFRSGENKVEGISIFKKIFVFFIGDFHIIRF